VQSNAQALPISAQALLALCCSQQSRAGGLLNISWVMVWLGDMPVDQTKPLSGDRTSGQFDDAWIPAVTGNMTWRF
jgi:hypothetical protein